MALSPTFKFSQGSLQDYLDCPRRFELRYLHRLAWPAVEAEPVLEHERYLRQGADFHRMVQQRLLGVPAERLEHMLRATDLERWWCNFSHFLENPSIQGGPQALSGRKHVEAQLSTCLEGHILVARYDLIVVFPRARAIILEWKTSRRRPPRRELAQRLQTRVYPFLLASAGAHLNGGQVWQPDQIEMVYWFADFPDEPECFPLEPARLAADQAYLAGLIHEITCLETGQFTQATDEKHCRFCVYRSLCDRGITAAALTNDAGTETLETFELDFSTLPEIEFSD